MSLNLIFKVKRSIFDPGKNVVVSSKLPGTWYFFLFTILLFGVGAACYFAIEYGQKSAGYNRSEAKDLQKELRLENGALLDQVNLLNNEVAVLRQELEIETGRRSELTGQISDLNEANGRLEEDLRFFEKLMASGGRDEPISVSSFDLDSDGIQGEYSFRVLIVQSKQRVKDFDGSLRFIVYYITGDNEEKRFFPAKVSSTNNGYKLNFKFYQRVEGFFELPVGSKINLVKVQVSQRGHKEPVIKKTFEFD